MVVVVGLVFGLYFGNVHLAGCCLGGILCSFGGVHFLILAGSVLRNLLYVRIYTYILQFSIC